MRLDRINIRVEFLWEKNSSNKENLLGRTVKGRIGQKSSNNMAHKNGVRILTWGRGKHRGAANEITQMLRAMSARMDAMEELIEEGLQQDIHDVSDEEQEVEAPWEEVEEVEAPRKRIIKALIDWRGRPKMETPTYSGSLNPKVDD
jgi:hypothetical protein